MATCSFRIGATSTAAANGMEDSLTKTLDKWESDAHHQHNFIKVLREVLANYSVCVSYADSLTIPY